MEEQKNDYGNDQTFINLYKVMDPGESFSIKEITVTSPYIYIKTITYTFNNIYSLLLSRMSSYKYRKFFVVLHYMIK